MLFKNFYEDILVSRIENETGNYLINSINKYKILLENINQHLKNSMLGSKYKKINKN